MLRRVMQVRHGYGAKRRTLVEEGRIRISSLNGYSMTVFSSLAIVERLIANGFAPGCWTPATIMGEDFIFSLPGTTTLELPG